MCHRAGNCANEKLKQFLPYELHLRFPAGILARPAFDAICERNVNTRSRVFALIMKSLPFSHL